MREVFINLADFDIRWGGLARESEKGGGRGGGFLRGLGHKYYSNTLRL